MSHSSLPALLGGAPIRPQGPPAWPFPDEEILQALTAAYRDGSWGKYHGRYVERLEARLAEYHGVAMALTCGSGTFAVELALRALKIGPDDEVILSAYDYGGNFLSIHALGAHPVLVDVEPQAWNLDPGRLPGAVGPASRAVIVSHLHGGIVPMPEVMTFAQAHGLRVIEDAAQAPGALIQGKPAGTWGDIGILSFGGSKLVSAGRGGAFLTRHHDLAQRARRWVNRGNHVCPLSELQAAVLLPQLGKLDERNALRARNVALLREHMRDLPGIRLFAPGRAGDEPGYYKLGWQYDAGQAGLPRTRFAAALRAEGIALDEGFTALHRGRSPRRFRQAGSLAEADRAHEGALVLHHPVLLGTPADIEEIARAVRKISEHIERLADE